MKRKMLAVMISLAVAFTFAVPVYAVDRTSAPCDIVMVLDQSGSMSEKYDSINTKQKALKNAAKEFLDEIGNSDNKVAVVSFSNDAKIVSEWKDMNTAGVSSLKSSINSLSDKPKGATYMDKGLAKARNLISSRAVKQYKLPDGSKKDRKVIVVLFTDGYPGQLNAVGDYFSSLYDTPNEADDAVYEASKLKKMGATVFTVGAFSGAKPSSDYTTKKKTVIWTTWSTAAKSENGLMHFISSDYDQSCTSWKKHTTSNDGRNNGYYLSADNTKQLKEAFADIASRCDAYTEIDAFDIDENLNNNCALGKYFRGIFGSNKFYNNQWQTMKTVEKLEDNVYLMDYKYDYDIHDLMNTGASSLTELLAYCSKHLLDGAFEFTYGNNPMGCSTVSAFTENGNSLMGRNFDYFDAPAFVVWTHPDDAYASIGMVDTNFMLYGKTNTPTSTMNRFQTLLAPYCVVDGMNEKGLCIAVLELDVKPTNQKTGKTDMVTTTMIRAALDTCANVEEAIALFDSYDMHDLLGACYHYQLCDADGNSVIIEYVNNEMRLIYPGDSEYDEYMMGYEGKDVSFASNFFLSKDADHSGDFGNSESDNGGNRAKAITDALKVTGGVMSESQLMGVLKDASMCYLEFPYPAYIKTLWSNVYNCDKGTVLMSPNMNYNVQYRFDVKKPKMLLN